MSSQNLERGGIGRRARFMLGWWIVPGFALSAATWAGVIWLIFIR